MATLKEVIQFVDDIKKNPWPIDKKVKIVSNVDCRIRSEVDKVYNSVDFAYSENSTYIMPDGVEFNDIDTIYFDSSQVDKLNVKGYGATLYNGVFNAPVKFTNMRIIYQEKLTPYRYATYTSGVGQISIANNGLRDILTTTGTDFENFKAADTVELIGFTDATNNKKALVLAVTSKTMEFVSGTFTTGSEANSITITRVLNDTLVLSGEDEEIYHAALMAKIDWWNKEYKSSNNNAALYNALWEAYEKKYQSKKPVDPNLRVRNIW